MDKLRQQLLSEILLKLNSENPSLYYASASEIAGAIYDWVHSENGWPKEKLEPLRDLEQEDIQYLLSFDEHRVDRF